MDLISFKNLCDNVSSERVIIERNTDEAYNLIYELCKNNIDEVSRRTRTLTKHIIFESIFNDTPSAPYLNILQLIFDAARHKDPSNNSNLLPNNKKFDNWKELITVALSAKNNSHFFKDESIGSSFNKNIEFSKSCKELYKYGIDFEFHNDNIMIKKESHEKVLNIIDKYLSKIGGVLILDYSFQMLAQIFNPTQERFQVYRKTSQGLDYIYPEVPWGYIISLGVKSLHIKNSLPYKQTITEYNSFIKFMTDIVSSFEIQPYIVWESIFVDNFKTIEFLQENILYDNLISFFQLKGDYAISIIDNILNYWKFDKIESFGISFEDIIKVGTAIIKISNIQNINLISKSKISKRCGLSIKKTEDIINKIYTNKNEKDLGFPPSSEAVDHVLSPLIPHQSMYISLPKAITSLSVLNCILNQVSKPNGIFDNSKDSSIGKFLEQFIWEQMTQHNIKCYRGDFKSKDKKTKGDCDLLIKNDNYIFLFEIKKKSLTRKAMSGTDFQIIKDLADSVMRSQSQCAKIEHVLLSDKELTLTIDNNKETIYYNNERIFKVSLSLHDFGALQDTNILSTILKLSMQVNFNAEDETINNMLSSWRQYVNTFTEYTIKNRKLMEVEDDNFRNNIFMSIPQLLTILDDSNSTNEFIEICKGAQHMTYSTRCFYKEYSLRKGLYKGRSN
ncbi:hypothetical protein K6I73_000877 [Salmonella enterica subsp. diarizonae serovar 35:k:e,n,x,z15]|nr:hypothetical protein [Salmonella enterica subsp. diarizonae]EBK4298551.1 hypothetical protein [Salmonella enterica]EIE2761336.1 hypothetical protein [Salmonella enterica subsp. diarizonae serovar 35:k:e,n,x,z15]EBQ8411366.1 hypothetical protein [Salmonella enterica]ECJ2207669.1 hypothetical protein [Salmonella enterica subsp. diarizonae]